MNNNNNNNNPYLNNRIQEVMQDPEVMAMMQQPGVMSKLQEAMSNPQRMMELMHDPDVQLLLRKMQQGRSNNNNNMIPSTSSTTTHSSKIIHINSLQQFNNIINNNSLVIIKYTASWCQPCKMIQPAFINLANENSKNGQIVFGEVDGDQNRDLVQSQQVRGFPTFHFYRHGNSVESFSGANEEKLRTTVDRYVEEVNQPIIVTYRHFPLKDSESVSYASCKYKTVIEQLKKFNDIVDEQYKLNDEEILLIENGLCSKLQDINSYHNTKLTMNEYNVFEKLLSFPTLQAAPGLHFARMMLRHPNAATHYVLNDEKSNNDTLDIISILLKYSISCVNDKPVNTILALRALINGFSRRVFTNYLLTRVEEVFDTISQLLNMNIDQKIQIAITTLLINFSIVFKEKPEIFAAGKIHLLSILLELLSNEKTDSNAIYRALIILGTLLVGDKDCQDIAQGMEVESIIKMARHTYGLSDSKNADHIQECVEDILKELTKE